MVITRRIPALVAVSLGVLTGCELIGGIEKRTLQANLSDGGVDDAGDAAADVEQPKECKLPPKANAAMRIGNLMPTTTRLDFCVKTADQTWNDVDPILAGGGGSCQRGLVYRNVSATFGVAGGSYDIIAVEDKGTAAPPKCTDPPVASANQVIVTEGDTISALVFGDSTSTAVLRAWKETRPSGSIESVVRFVNGLVGAGNLDCGISGEVKNDLPATIAAGAFADVPFASFTPPAGQGSTPSGKIDANGYLQIQAPGAEVAFAAAAAGTTDAILVKSHIYDRGGGFSLFAAGRMGDKQFPEELFVCDESKVDGILARCGGIPVTVTVDSVNVQLAGAWGPYDKERAPLIYQAIAALPSDVVCVHEAWGKANKDGIAQAAQANFPNQSMPFYDENSPVDDPTDQTGATPPEYDEPPCAQSEAKFSSAMDCVRDNCVDPADETGVPKPFLSQCVTSKCVGSFLPLLTGTPEDKACYSCLFTSLAGWESIGSIRNKCTTDPKARFAHGGDAAVAVLSRYPIQGAESWVLGATEWRVNIVRAPVTLPNSAVVDVYCTQLTTPGSGISRPYTGQYGLDSNGAPLGSDDAWRAELYLQAEKLVNFVHSRSSAAKRKALIVGSIYAGPSYYDGETKVLDEVNVQAYNTVSADFPLAVPQGYVPTCTLCNDNPILSPPGSTPATGGSWQSFVFLHNLPITAAESVSIFWKETALSVINPANQEPFDIPLSTHYGFRSVVRILK